VAKARTECGCVTYGHGARAYTRQTSLSVCKNASQSAMSLDVTLAEGAMVFSAYVESGAGTVVVPAIGELDLAAIPGGRRAMAALNGDGRALVLVLTNPTGPALRRRPVLELGLLGRDRAVVKVDGRRLQLSRRQSEIVALLSARPGGMTTEELAADLYGDAGHPSTVRVQVCRLRKQLGGWIEADPYRLAARVECDATRVRGLLQAGAIREAAERYEGQLLPHSEAPGIVRQRDALDAWLRHAVMTADDGSALWAWLQSPSGSEDLLAWKRLLADLSFHDPRRSLAAARVRSLREAYGAPEPNRPGHRSFTSGAA
jgi:hypothetical protein